MLFTNSVLPEHCRSLFLGDLSCFCQEADVYRFFLPFGEIEEIRIKRNHDGIGLGYGFITFASRESAELALRKDGDVLVGRPLRVSWATARGNGNSFLDNNSNHNTNHSSFKNDFPMMNVRKAKGTLKNGPPESAQIHFSFISKQTQRVVTEATIRDVFSHFGEVKDVTIKKTTSLPRTGQQTGYGFLDYPLTDEGIEAAIKASRIVKQVHIYDVLCFVSLGLFYERIVISVSDKNIPLCDISELTCVLVSDFLVCKEKWNIA